MSKTLQIEVWHTCRNRCKFCYLKGDENTPRMEMIKNLQNAYSLIENKETWEEYDTLSFIGGEIFQGEMDNEFIPVPFSPAAPIRPLSFSRLSVQIRGACRS